MKKLLFCFLGLLTTELMGQTPYHPMFEDSKWFIKTLTYGGEFYGDLTTDGDTTVGTHTYKKFVVGGTSYTYLAREDTAQRRIWAIYPYQSSEILIYDFNVNVSDQIILENIKTPLNYSTFNVDSIINISTPVGLRKKYYLRNIVPQGYPGYLTWIEGVGSAQHPFEFSYGYPYESYPTVMCSSHGSTMVYDAGDTCGINLSSSCTQTIMIFDTNTVVAYDTVTTFIYDTNTTVKYDTSQSLIYDTAMVSVIDTTPISVYDSLSVTDTLIIDINFTGISASENSIKVYPNPTAGNIIIDNGNYALMSGYSIRIDNLSGQLLFHSPINKQQFILDLNMLGGYGTYLISIYDQSNDLVTIRKISLQ